MLVVFPLPLYMSAVNRAGPLSFMLPPPSSLYERGQQSWSIVLHAPPPSSLYECGQQSWSIVLHAPPPFLFIWARSTELVHCPSCRRPLPPPPSPHLSLPCKHFKLSHEITLEIFLHEHFNPGCNLEDRPLFNSVTLLKIPYRAEISVC